MHRIANRISLRSKACVYGCTINQLFATFDICIILSQYNNHTFRFVNNRINFFINIFFIVYLLFYSFGRFRLDFSSFLIAALGLICFIFNFTRSNVKHLIISMGKLDIFFLSLHPFYHYPCLFWPEYHRDAAFGS